MVNLRQKELREWMKANFDDNELLNKSKEELVEMIRILQVTTGMAEEVGEICHHILKGTQGIREGVNGIDKTEIADGVVDTGIFGSQLLSLLGVDHEHAIEKVTTNVLSRDWNKYKIKGVATRAKFESTLEAYKAGYYMRLTGNKKIVISPNGVELREWKTKEGFLHIVNEYYLSEKTQATNDKESFDSLLHATKCGYRFEINKLTDTYCSYNIYSPEENHIAIRHSAHAALQAINNHYMTK